MRISKHDKNLVQLLMIAEVLTKSITDELSRLEASAPSAKSADYEQIKSVTVPLHDALVSLNDAMTDQVNVVMSDEDQSLLIDSALSICLLLETQNPKRIAKIMREVGITQRDIVENYLGENK